MCELDKSGIDILHVGGEAFTESFFFGGEIDIDSRMHVVKVKELLNDKDDHNSTQQDDL